MYLTVIGFAALVLTNCAANTSRGESVSSNNQISNQNATSPAVTAGTSNIDQERTRNRRIVEDFFTRLEAMDIRGFVSLFDEAGVQEMPYSPAGFPKELRGRAAIEKQYGGLPQSYNSMRFINRVWYETVDPAVFVVSYKGVIDVKNGKPYNNDYVGIWQLRDGKIIRYREHFNPIILREAFGKNLDKNFNVN